MLVVFTCLWVHLRWWVLLGHRDPTVHSCQKGESELRCLLKGLHLQGAGDWSQRADFQPGSCSLILNGILSIIDWELLKPHRSVWPWKNTPVLWVAQALWLCWQVAGSNQQELLGDFQWWKGLGGKGKRCSKGVWGRNNLHYFANMSHLFLYALSFVHVQWIQSKPNYK